MAEVCNCSENRTNGWCNCWKTGKPAVEKKHKLSVGDKVVIRVDKHIQVNKNGHTLKLEAEQVVGTIINIYTPTWFGNALGATFYSEYSVSLDIPLCDGISYCCSIVCIENDIMLYDE